MGDFEEKLNAILSSPEAMAQVASLAQSLGMGSSPPPPAAGTEGTEESSPPPPPGPDLSALFGQADPALLSRLLPLLQELGSGENDQRAQLLQSLRPFLKESRQVKLDRAMQIARLLRVGKKFFSAQGEM